MAYLVYVAAGLLALIVWIWRNTTKPARFPPGPPRVPLLGSIPYMKPSKAVIEKYGLKQRSVMHMSQQLVADFGKVVGVYFGSMPTIFIGDYEVLKDVLKREESALRPAITPFNAARFGGDQPGQNGREMGVALASGSHWREQRRFALRHLRDFGFGKSSMEEALHEEVAKLIEMLSKQAEKPIDLNSTMNVAILNALWAMVAGETLPLDDPKLKHHVKQMSDVLQQTNPMHPLVQLLPSKNMATWHIFEPIFKWNQAQKSFQSLGETILEYAKEHRETQDPNNPRDFMDLYLQEIQGTTDPKSSFFGEKGTLSMVNSISDLFVAGMETTSSSLLWSMLYLIHHVDVQEKVQQEIDKVVGVNRLPSLSDSSEMPYTNAVIQECFRSTALVHHSIPHFTDKEIVVGQYVIPANSMIMPNIYHVHYDADYWKDPEAFRPERFIDGDGKFVADERVIPFSIGKRYCPGQPLAEKEFFLFFTGLLQKFSVRAAAGHKLPSYDAACSNPLGGVRLAPTYHVVLTVRK